MAKKSRKPIFLDEPIQWHLSTTAHDHCPFCGGDVGILGARQRTCLGRCSYSFHIPMSTKKWLERKMLGERPVNYREDLIGDLPVIHGVPAMSLIEAQRDSLDSVARIPIRMAANLIEYAFWKKGAYEPQDDPSLKKQQYIRAGTPLWRALVTATTWQPNNPKTVLDKMIDDEPAKLIRRKVSVQ